MRWQRHDVFDQVHELDPELLIGVVQQIHEDEFGVHFDGVAFLVGHPDGFQFHFGDLVSELVDDGLNGESLLHGFEQRLHKSVQEKFFQFFFLKITILNNFRNFFLIFESELTKASEAQWMIGMKAIEFFCVGVE